MLHAPFKFCFINIYQKHSSVGIMVISDLFASLKFTARFTFTIWGSFSHVYG